MASRLTWRLEPKEKGLAGVVQEERGYDLFCDGEQVGSVRPLFSGLERRKLGYFWYAGSEKVGVPTQNTSDAPVADIEVTKAQCRAYVQRFLDAAQNG